MALNLGRIEFSGIESGIGKLEIFRHRGLQGASDG